MPSTDAADALREALGQVVADLRREWRAEAAAQLGELKGLVADIALKALGAKTTEGISPALAKTIADAITADAGVTFDGDRTMFIHIGKALAKITLAVPLDRGVYDPTRTYERGDGVSSGGSFHLAQRAVKPGEKPGEGDAWRMAAKKGRDARPVTRRETALSDVTMPARPAQRRAHGRSTTNLRIVGDITRAMAKEFEKESAAAALDSLVVEIDSPGGDALAGLTIYETLITHRHHVEVRIAKASSAAAIAAMGGDLRRIHPGGTVFVHQTEGGDEVDRLAVDKAAAEIIAAATTQTPAVVAQWEKAATTFDAAEAIRVGLVHEVIG